jgi:hypothetical protein
METVNVVTTRPHRTCCATPSRARKLERKNNRKPSRQFLPGGFRVSGGNVSEAITKMRVLYELPDMDQVQVRSEGALDLYTPAGTGPFPVVVIVAGYRDEGFRARLGCSFQQMQSTVSWAQLIAASGMAAVTYTNQDPAADFFTVLRTIREHAEAWDLDAQRIGLWSSSGNVPVALSALMRDSPERVQCAALLYGCILDLDGHTGIADAATLFGFANPVAGRAFDDVRPDVPLFIARAGRDQTPGLNDALDRFVARAVAGNLPLTFVNHATGVHAFDLFDDSEATREVIRQGLRFLQFTLNEAQERPGVR